MLTAGGGGGGIGDRLDLYQASQNRKYLKWRTFPFIFIFVIGDSLGQSGINVNGDHGIFPTYEIQTSM